MSMKIRGAVVAAALVAGMSAAALPAFADEGGVKVGVLTCNASSGWGFIFGSSRTVNCEFSSGPGSAERYSGSISKFGVDIGYLRSGVIIWTVFAPSSTLAPGSLSGNYAGVTGSAAVGVGAGANALVGGSGNHIMLQPVSIEGQTGLNVAAGIAALDLKVEKPESHAQK